jgi:hypothetical protein
MLDINNKTIGGAALILAMSAMLAPNWQVEESAEIALVDAAKPVDPELVIDSYAERSALVMRPTDKPARSREPISNRSRTILFAYAQYGMDYQAKAFIEIVWRESRFNHKAKNPSSGAYGLGQALPPEKMDSVGADWRNNPMTQLKWVAKYIEERYGSPAEALAHHDDMGWY